ncbi:MAG: hypothetical protein SFX73_31615 [Kofleriaceae bacterium]|nr:hypothetical protein [Kofleriaceae bacterium]
MDQDSQGLIADLRGRLEDAMAELDRQVAEHPFATVGLAFAAGAVLAMGPRARHEDEERTLGGLITAGLSALAIRAVKSYAWSRLSAKARGLFDPMNRERDASRDASVEAFLEH